MTVTPVRRLLGSIRSNPMVSRLYDPLDPWRNTRQPAESVSLSIKLVVAVRRGVDALTTIVAR